MKIKLIKNLWFYVLLCFSLLLANYYFINFKNLEPFIINNFTEWNNNNNCKYHKNNFSNNFIDNYEVIELTNEISVFPEIWNIKCLSKVNKIIALNQSEIIIEVSNSQKFINFVTPVVYIFFVVLILKIYKTRNKYFLSILFLISGFSFTKIFNVNLSLFKLFGLYFLGLIFIYTLNSNFLKKLNFLNITKIKYREDINALRGIAVLGVVIYHANLGFLAGGWLGVDIFFVISGYLISNIIFSELVNNKFSFKQFYLRRIKRILPAFYFMMLLTTPLTYFLLTPKASIEFLNNLKYSTFFSSNYYLLNLDFYTAEPSSLNPLLHVWSLAIEEQFYIFFPFLIFILFRFKKSLIKHFLLILIFFSIFLNLLNFNENEIFYNTPFRIWEILIGVFIMLLEQNKFDFKFNKINQILPLILILFSYIFFDDLYINSLMPKLISIFAVSIILLNENFFLTGLNSLNLFKYIGLSSFSIYLFHQPVFVFTRLFLIKNEIYFNLTYKILIIFFVLTISLISYKFIELKFINDFNLMKKSSLIIILCLLNLYSFVGTKNNGFINRFSHLPEKIFNYSVNISPMPSGSELTLFGDYNCTDYKILGFNKIYNDSQESPCFFNNNNSELKIILLGDSHGNNLATSIIQNSNKFNLSSSFIPLTGTTGRCLLTGQTDFPGDRFDCTKEFFNSFVNKLDNQSDVLIVVGRYPIWLSEVGNEQFQCDRNCDYIKEFKDRLIYLSQKSKYLIILYPIPTQDLNVAESYFYGINTWGETISSSYSEWNLTSKKSKEFLEEFNYLGNVYFINPEEVLCNYSENTRCVAAIDNFLFYTDDDHLSIEGNNLISELIAEVVSELDF